MAGAEKIRPAGDLLTHMLIGYSRVSTHDQTLNLQKDALQKAGCTKIFTDTATGATEDENTPPFVVSPLAELRTGLSNHETFY